MCVRMTDEEDCKELDAESRACFWSWMWASYLSQDRCELQFAAKEPARRKQQPNVKNMQAPGAIAEKGSPRCLVLHGRQAEQPVFGNVLRQLEVGGRWSEETANFLRLLAVAKARSETPLRRRRVEQAWRLRWSSMLACTVGRALAASLLDQRTNVCGDGEVPPTHEVLREFRFAGLG